MHGCTSLSEPAATQWCPPAIAASLISRGARAHGHARTRSRLHTTRASTWNPYVQNRRSSGAAHPRRRVKVGNGAAVPAPPPPPLSRWMSATDIGRAGDTKAAGPPRPAREDSERRGPLPTPVSAQRRPDRFCFGRAGRWHGPGLLSCPAAAVPRTLSGEPARSSFG